MDTKIIIKEEDPLAATQNESEFLTKNVTLKTNSDAVLMDSDCDVAVKTEIKSEIPFLDFHSPEKRECFIKHFVNQTKCATITCSNNCEKETKIKIDLERKTEFPLEDSEMQVMKNSDHEMDNKIEIKEETWCLETENSSLCNDIKDKDLTPIKSPRLYTEADSGGTSTDPQLFCAAALWKDPSFIHEKTCPEHESQGSNTTKILSIETCVYSEQSSKCSVGGKVYNRTLLTHKNGKSHKCNICKKSFTQSSTLKSHTLIHEGKKPYKCEICGRSFTHLSHLKSHNLIHEGKKPHKCEICEQSFRHLSTLKRHSLIHEGKKPHKCEICGKSFTRFSYVQLHNLIHEGKRPHKCEVCDRSFTHLSALRRHDLIHMGKKPHKCKICGKSFTLLNNLKSHNLTHQDKKLYKCEICAKNFTHLKSHNLIHEGKQPHKCEICGKSFTHMSSLKRHNLIHEGKKPYKCRICGRSFTLLSHLKSHNSTHESIKRHKCEICGKSFNRLRQLKNHNLIH